MVLAQFDIKTAKEGDYFKNDSLRFLEGKWIGINSKNDTIRLILKFKQKAKIGSFYMDYVAGWYEYTENGIIESSSMIDTFDFKNSAIYINSSIDKSLMFFLTDKGKSNGSASGIIIPNSPSPNELIWKIESIGESGPVWLSGDSPPPARVKSKLTVTREWKMVRIKD